MTHTTKGILLTAMFLIAINASAQTEWKKTCRAGAEYQFTNGEIKPCPDRGFFRPFGPGFKASSAAYWTAVFADMANTKQLIGGGGYAEFNPLIRNRQGGLSVPKYLAFNGGIYGATLLLERKHPKKAAIIRFVHAAIHIGIVAHSRKGRH